MERILAKNNEEDVASRVAAFLKQGHVVAAPTDTVYGLVADARSDVAIERVFVIKGRGLEKSLPIFVSSFEMLDDVAFVKDSNVKEFLHKCWPGKVTCVLPSRGWMPISVRNRGLTIGVRMPDYPLILKIMEKLGGPVTGTSANLSGRNSLSRAEGVEAEFKHVPFKPDLLIDGGELPESQPSTVLDCTVWPPKILRRGAVSEEEIFHYTGYN
ncbi:MAG: L-threonylcarbamoyladenylate synthase [Patescibacteria group bacterium]